ncbi:hypothetical protein Egran_01697, partial [Elaphomyces granulatus]
FSLPALFFVSQKLASCRRFPFSLFVHSFLHLVVVFITFVLPDNQHHSLTTGQKCPLLHYSETGIFLSSINKTGVVHRKMQLCGIVAFFGLLAIAVTQQSATVSLSPEVSCEVKCDPKDICCRANCAKVPCPNNQMANQTTACVAGCPQGNGSVADTANYAKCIQSCYSSLFFPATVTTDGSVSGATNVGSGTSAGSGASGTSGANNGSGSGSGSGTATAASTSTSKAAAASYQTLQLGASGAGLLGVILAVFAL